MRAMLKIGLAPARFVKRHPEFQDMADEDRDEMLAWAYAQRYGWQDWALDLTAYLSVVVMVFIALVKMEAINPFISVAAGVPAITKVRAWRWWYYQYVYLERANHE